MRRYTVDDIMALRPCSEYTRSRVEELWAGRDGLTAREIAALDIPIGDRTWALSCLLGDSRPVARRIALDVIDRWKAPEIMRRYLETGDEDVRIAAWSAAVSAFGAAASVAVAWSVAVAAAVSADREKYLGWLVEAHEARQ